MKLLGAMVPNSRSLFKTWCKASLQCSEALSATGTCGCNSSFRLDLLEQGFCSLQPAQVTEETSLQALHRIAEEAKDAARPPWEATMCGHDVGVICC